MRIDHGLHLKYLKRLIAVSVLITIALLASSCRVEPPAAISTPTLRIDTSPTILTTTHTATPIPSSTPAPSETPKPAPTETDTSTPAEIGETALVRRVLDGDTIEVQIGENTFRLRYIGIDSPEDGQPFSQEASDLNRRLVEGKKVFLEKDIS